ncbi:hypothetical protein JMJ77_0002254 [Colletotrichum scovillei]|uniref:Uncharacterized protein n=1 Tax=Colletotrichum scovillei TaxID=1209932 RepID=A0A9P7UE01_9PEZI|nr:hypothetical protein JMJ77_0002254 [Colletotrichum scovillei]KAG7070673.1 hypothetical protein JMJ76_0001920 [Colletotrichum scovillei]KAG7078887.1 hypothetical protein JMJ78_0002550 [Colletotrichum scovillei]
MSEYADCSETVKERAESYLAGTVTGSHWWVLEALEGKETRSAASTLCTGLAGRERSALWCSLVLLRNGVTG